MSQKDLKQWIDTYFDEDLSVAELRQFEEMLKADRKLQKQLLKESYFRLQLRMGLTPVSQAELALNDLVEAVMMDQQMSQSSPLFPSLDMGCNSDSFGEVLRSTVMNVLSSVKFLWTVMLFSIGLFSLMMFLLIPKSMTLDGPVPYKKVTHVSQTVNAVWGSGVPEDLNLLLKGTRLDLRSGLAQVEYKNGTRVNLEGPTIFVISDENEGTLLSGKISAQMDEEAKKFTIVTPTGKITDLGTEFGIIVDRQKNTDVQVFDGKIKLAVSGTGKSTVPLRTLELVEADAVRINSAARTVSKILYTPLRFARSYKNLRPYYYDDFSTDTSSAYATSFTRQGTRDGSFSIEGGVLSVRVDSDTCSVISNHPLLGTGEFFMVDVPGIDPFRSEISLVIATQPAQPTGGAGGVFGFRLRRGQGLVVEKFDSLPVSQDGNTPNATEEMRIDDPLFGRPIRLVVERRTATDFVFYYESNDGRTRITDVISNPDLENFTRLHVGVEVVSPSQEDVKIFDNLIVYPSVEPQ